MPSLWSSLLVDFISSTNLVKEGDYGEKELEDFGLKGVCTRFSTAFFEAKSDIKVVSKWESSPNKLKRPRNMRLNQKASKYILEVIVVLCKRCQVAEFLTL